MTGGLAIAAHAEPRTTCDIDVVLPSGSTGRDLAAVAAALGDRYHSRRDVRTLLRVPGLNRDVLAARAADLGVLGLLTVIASGPEPL